MKKISVNLEDTHIIEPSLQDLSNWTHQVLNLITVVDSDIKIKIVDDEVSEYHNMVYRNRPNSTNVLSFPEGDNSGLIILCDPVIHKEAKKSKHTRNRSLFSGFYIHGVLHLCGYTHEYDHDEAVMTTVENKLFDIFKKNKS